jgi:hypothetical protein
MDQNYILKLAIEELQRQKAGIEAEIEMIRAELSKSGSFATRKGKTPVVGEASAGRKRSRTVAEKKAQSEKMRKYWAAKRSAAKK